MKKLMLKLYELKNTMESIVSFSFTELTCKFSLNRRGPRKYGNLTDLLTSGSGIPSTVGLADGTDALRQDIRLSTRFTSFVVFDTEKIDLNTVDEKLKPLDSTVYWEPSTHYSVIEYGPGGFFSEHSDKKQKRNHCATLLIFPPAVDALAHTGGELILDRGRFRFDSSANREWTFVAFHMELPHECLPIITGKRVVLKTELYSKSVIQRAMPEIRPMVCDGSLRYMMTVDGNLPEYDSD
jgi:hypothetical protein